MDDHERSRYLAVYLNDHLAGATAGRARFARSARAHRGSVVGEVLERIGGEVAQDRRVLLRWMRVLGVQPRWALVGAARVGEAVGALKPNGRLVRSSPLRTVVELEALVLGVQGKAALWGALLELGSRGAPLPLAEVEALLVRAQRQAVELEELRREAVRDVLAPGGPPGPR
ncbi:hypothetical protein [Kineococcus sp. SYSU DK002]|uniref:hypothetical protein n=1 Tax=Kineococcus sp. SYSU DK002 TaxID=3383123 RepID=UPI003D7E7630